MENVPEEDKNSILSSLPPKDRFALLESLSYPEDTAARLMQREFTAIPSNWSVGQTIDYLRENKDLPEEFLEIFIVNEDFKPIGTVPSSRVLTTPRDTKMATIMSESQLLIPVEMDKEEVANLFENYNLNSAAVVDKNNKLVGMIMNDDVLTVLKEEAEEDALRLAGVGDEEITDGVVKKTKRRFNWLLLNLFTAFLATWCISLFGATIEQMVVLAKTTICSMVAPNKLIHHVARKAVNKLSKSQLNLLFVFFTTPSVISSSPTPANLKASSSASSFKTVKTSSFIIIPTNLLFLSTTAAEFKL